VGFCTPEARLSGEGGETVEVKDSDFIEGGETVEVKDSDFIKAWRHRITRRYVGDLMMYMTDLHGLARTGG
jgi:hypothetical protein